MKALFVSVYSDTPHFETELELICDLLEDGHEIVVLRCTGQLGTCLKNPGHKEHICRVCVSKVDAGLVTLAQPRLRVETMRHVIPDSRLPNRFVSAHDLLHYTLDGAELGRGVYSTMCGRANKDTHLDTDTWATTIRAELEAAHAVYVATREAIAKHKPDRVYIFNGRFATCHAAIVACEKEHVAYFTHERGGTPDRFLVRERALPHNLAINTAEIEEVWGEGGPDKEATARRWYVERRNGVERSWESFTKAQTRGMLPDGFDRKKRNIAIFNSTMEEYASMSDWANRLYEDEVVGTCRIVDDLAARADTHVYLRVHPHMKNIPRHDNYQLRTYAELEKRATNLTIIWPESPVHTYELIDRSTIVLTFGSTVGAEACFWGTPSVLAGRALYEKLDCTHNPNSHAEVMKLLTGHPDAKQQLGALKYAYWETVRGTPFRRFRPTGLYTGEWLGRRVRASLSARLRNALLSRVDR